MSTTTPLPLAGKSALVTGARTAAALDETEKVRLATIWRPGVHSLARIIRAF